MDFLDRFDKIDTPDKLSLLFQLRTLLESLLDKKFIDPIDSDNFANFGLSQQLPNILIKDQAKLRQIIDTINFRLEEWRQLHNNDINILLSTEPNLDDDFRSGIYSILGQIYLSDPYNVAKMEQKYNLPVTGDRIKLMHNWNAKYYGIRCLAYVNPESCLKKAIEHNDVENFSKIYPSLRDDLFINELVDLIKIAATYGRVVIFAELFKDYIKNNDNNSRDLEGYDYIKNITSLDLFKIIYSYPDMFPTISIALDDVARRKNREFSNYLVKIAMTKPTPNILFNIAGGAKLNDWNDLIESSLKKLREITSEEQYNKYFNYIQTI